MNRRTFLATGAAAYVHRVLAQDAPPASKKRKLPKAVNLQMAKGYAGASIMDRFKMIQDAGFEGVELNRPDADPIDQLIAARDATGLKIANVICSTHWGKPLTHQDPAVREQGIRGLKIALQESAELGCPTVLLVPGVVNEHVSYADAYTRSQAGIRQVLADAEQAEVKIAIENVWNNFLLSPLEAARFVDELQSPFVGWHFDIGNIVAYGWPEHWIAALGSRTLTLHIKEYSRKKQQEEGMRKGFNVELGEGDVGWPRVMKALNAVGYHDWAVLEVPGGDAARLKFLAERTDQLLAS